TRHFISQWMQFALDLRPFTLGTPAQRTLIRDREALLKRNRARLLHREYLQMYSGATGADPLHYRWGTAHTMANDILRGLHSEATDAVAAYPPALARRLAPASRLLVRSCRWHVVQPRSARIDDGAARFHVLRLGGR